VVCIVLARLAALTRVSEQILAATTVEALLQQVVDAARELIDARMLPGRSVQYRSGFPWRGGMGLLRFG
jgi:hypothetical protein